MGAVQSDEAETWPARLAHRAATSGDAVALWRKTVGEWRSQTWRQLNADVIRLGNALSARGLSPADTLLVEGDPGPEAVTLTLAVQRLGGIVVWGEAGSSAAIRDDARFVVGDDSHARSVLPARCTRIAIDALEAERADEGSVSYSRLLAQESQSAAGDVASEGARADALRVVTSRGEERLTHAELVAEGRALLASNRIGPDDRALSPAGVDAVATAVFFAAWLAGGFCVHFAETSDTRASDRREVAPSILFESAPAYEKLHRDVLDALPSAGTLQRKLVDWGLDRDRRGALGARLVGRPLRRILGLSRVRHCLVVGGRVEGATLAFYAALGLTPSTTGGARFELDGPPASSSTIPARRPLEPIEAEGEAS